MGSASEEIRKIIQSPDALKQAMIAGTQAYLDAAEGRPTAAAAEAQKLSVGISHGAKGLARAKHVLAELKKEHKEISLLALLHATMSQSNWLALCIANKIILGKYTLIVCTITDCSRAVAGQNITSSALTQSILDASKRNSDLYTKYGSQVESNWFYQKDRAIRAILESFTKQLEKSDKTAFLTKVQAFETQLNTPFIPETTLRDHYWAVGLFSERPCDGENQEMTVVI